METPERRNSEPGTELKMLMVTDKEMEANGGGVSKLSPETSNTTPKKSTRILFLVVTGISQILQFTAMSLLPPFFPLEATKKGATPIEYGLIMGTCFLAVAATSIPWGYVTTRLPIKWQLVISLHAIGVFTTGFGFVDRVPNGEDFLAASFSLRILAGIAVGVYQVAAYTMLPVVLVGRESTGFAVMEMGVGLGYVLGPAVGGILFELGGLWVPCVACSIPIFVMVVMNVIFIENLAVAPTSKSVSVVKLMLSPAAILYTIIIFSTELDFGFLAVTLEPFLNKFHLSHAAIGGIILGSGAAYALTSPLWGHLCDKGVSAEWGSLLGTIMNCVVFLLIAPVPWLPYRSDLWLIIICVILCGLGVAAKMICAFKLLLHSALSRGFPNSVATYAAVSSIFTMVVSIGGFAGPAVGGFLEDLVGMRSGTAIMFYWQMSLVAAQVCYMFFRWRCASSGNRANSNPKPLAINGNSNSNAEVEGRNQEHDVTQRL